MVTQLQPDVRAYLHGGEVIKRYITGMDGKATAKNLPLGQYRVVEVEVNY